MKDILPANSGYQSFLDGLVFGFDVGTGSIGYAVRRGSQFLDVGVLICDSEGGDLSKRRELRRQRRTLRSKRFRRRWFSDQLLKLGLTRPPVPRNDPIELRFRALNGERLRPGELYAALTHLFRRRGYTEVPWANCGVADTDLGKEEGIIREQVKEIREELRDLHPCQFLMNRQRQVGKSPTDKWARKIYWPREALEAEFRAIVSAQTASFPQLASKIDWLLYGDCERKTRNGRDFHVYFKNTRGRNPGVLGLKWPRFDNRSPALDSLQPIGEKGPLHVVRRDREAFQHAQWELALMNFRVLDASTRQIIDPRKHFPDFISSLRREWEKKNRISEAQLKKIALPWADEFLLIEGQKSLTPESGSGRARYSSPTLERIRNAIQAGESIDPPQPILQRAGEASEQALNRLLADMKHPVVRHRLVLFRELLARLIEKHGQPGLIVLEAVRSLALGKKAKNELNKRNDQYRKERELARGDLIAAGKSVSRKAITRYRLWKEALGVCPFCGEKITQEQLLNGQADIEHLVPRAAMDCSELYNLTIGHIRCNRELKGDRTSYAAFSSDREKWEQLSCNAQKCFKGKKLEIFLSPNAEELIERKADLQHTAYIARTIRHVSLIQLGWVGKDGRDPTIEKGNIPSSCFQVTNGQLTSRLRGAWGLNQILHPLASEARWDDLPEAEKEKFAEKNRGDLRHHALDAMVIACTLPWLAHRTVGALDPRTGEHGWWELDRRTQRSKALNPIFPHAGRMYEVCKDKIKTVRICHHVSRSNHQQAYATTLYAKKAPDTYVAREIFHSLTPKNLGSIWPKEFAYYCEAAWHRYSEESAEIEAEVKKSKDCIPENFTKRLCFSHFQKWRADGAPEFSWPETVKIPIRSVRLISVKDDLAVMPFSPGTHAFVKRTEFKEVRIHLSADGKSLVPVFIPYWRKDSPVADRPFGAKARAANVVRRGQLVQLSFPEASRNPSGLYRVVATMRGQIKLMPPHIKNDKDALLASGFFANGVNLAWDTFLKAAGYELPHTPPS